MEAADGAAPAALGPRVDADAGPHLVRPHASDHGYSLRLWRPHCKPAHMPPLPLPLPHAPCPCLCTMPMPLLQRPCARARASCVYTRRARAPHPPSHARSQRPAVRNVTAGVANFLDFVGLSTRVCGASYVQTSKRTELTAARGWLLITPRPGPRADGVQGLHVQGELQP